MMEVPSLAGEYHSEERPSGKFSGYRNSVTYVMTRSGPSFLWRWEKYFSSLFLLGSYHPWPGTLVLPKHTTLLPHPGQEGYSLWPERLDT